jgi:hypothetical protein
MVSSSTRVRCYVADLFILLLHMKELFAVAQQCCIRECLLHVRHRRCYMVHCVAFDSAVCNYASPLHSDCNAHFANVGAYLRVSKWHVLDFVCALGSIMSWIPGLEGGSSVKMLRALRVFRPLTMVNKLPRLQVSEAHFATSYVSQPRFRTRREEGSDTHGGGVANGTKNTRLRSRGADNAAASCSCWRRR